MRLELCNNACILARHGKQRSLKGWNTFGLALGASFAFVMAFGDFFSPFYLSGSKPPTLFILIIDTTKSGQHWPQAAVVTLTPFAVTTAAVKVAQGRRR